MHLRLRGFIACCFILISCLSKSQDSLSVKDADTTSMPSFAGGIQAIQQYVSQKISYPLDAREKGIEGIVMVAFIVDEEGKVREEKVTKGIFPSLDKEALRVVHEMSPWKPAVKNEKPVAAQMHLPIKFTLQVPDKKDHKKSGSEKN